MVSDMAAAPLTAAEAVAAVGVDISRSGASAASNSRNSAPAAAAGLLASMLNGEDCARARVIEPPALVAIDGVAVANESAEGRDTLPECTAMRPTADAVDGGGGGRSAPAVVEVSVQWPLAIAVSPRADGEDEVGAAAIKAAPEGEVVTQETMLVEVAVVVAVGDVTHGVAVGDDMGDDISARVMASLGDRF